MNTRVPDIKLCFFLLLIVCFFPAAIVAFDHQAGLHGGSCSYENDIGAVYDKNTLMVGLNYQFLFYPMFGLNVQYDFIAVSSGEIVIYDHNHHYRDHLTTRISGGIFSLSPTIFFRFREEQFLVPQFGAGLSLFHGQQTFDDSIYCVMSDNDVSGSGFNFSAGLDFNISSRYSLHLGSRYHSIRVSIEEGPERTETKYNGIAEYHLGVIIRLGQFSP